MAYLNETVVNADGMSGSSYQLLGGQYLYLWKPAKFHRTVWRIGVRLEDGTTYTVDVAFK